MSMRACVVGALVAGAFPVVALGQFAPTGQERSTVASAVLGNGAEGFDGSSAPGMGPWSHTAAASRSEVNGGGAEGSAGHNTTVSSSLISGSLTASTLVRTGSTFITGEAQGHSSFLALFSVAAPTPVSFTGGGSVVLNGLNPDGEPSDLYGRARVQLINADTDEPVAGFLIFPGPGSDGFTFSGTLPAGNYALMANAFSYAFSADLLGPPARSGGGETSVNFALTVVPTPSAAALLGLAGVVGVAGGRRRR
ncbi:MAG TPA: hypothetical protein VD997_15585 [Phycisphaerales bacterium]|nr:hypothetical protein [Phycisphaerales bacterium]